MNSLRTKSRQIHLQPKGQRGCCHGFGDERPNNAVDFAAQELPVWAVYEGDVVQVKQLSLESGRNGDGWRSGGDSSRFSTLSVGGSSANMRLL